MVLDYTGTVLQYRCTLCLWFHPLQILRQVTCSVRDVCNVLTPLHRSHSVLLFLFYVNSLLMFGVCNIYNGYTGKV